MGRFRTSTQFRSIARFWSIVCLLLVISSISVGCEDAFIDPFKNEGKFFTLYGFLDQGKNFEPGATHAIRVIPVTRNRENIETPESPQADIDGRVFLTNLTTEVTVEMNHALEELSAGTYGHIFRTNAFIQDNHRYRIEVIREDGTITSAETHVPAVSGIETIQKTLQVNSDSSVVFQDIVLSYVQAIWNIDIIYYTGSSICFTSTARTVPYGRVGAPSAEGWALQLNISEDLAVIENQLQVQGLFVCAMGIRAQIMDDDWTLPEGEINFEEISLPDNQTNVVNGYGFFGSTSEYEFDWPLRQDLNDVINAGDG